METPARKPTPAEKWDGLFSKGAAYKPLNVVFAGKLLERVRDISGKKPESVLDLGCGTGNSLRTLKEAGITDVAGVDCSKVALEEAGKTLSNCELALCDMNEGLGEDGKQYDLLLCKLTIAFIEDKGKFLSSAKNLMHDSSVLCIITPVLHEGIAYVKEDKPGIAVKYNEFRALLDKTFGTVEEFHHDYHGERGDIMTFLLKK